MLTIENQLEDLEKKNVVISQLTSEKSLLAVRVETLQKNLRDIEVHVSDLKEDKARIEEQLRSGDDSARVLDEYKKRAQMALKKVLNSTLSSTLQFLIIHVAKCLDPRSLYCHQLCHCSASHYIPSLSQ